MDAGIGVREIATAFGMSRSTLYRWRALAQRTRRGGGAASGRAGEPHLRAAGREPDEEPDYHQPLRERILGGPPAAGSAGAEPALWSVETVRATLAHDFGVRTTAADALRILRAIGLWPGHPLRRHHQLAAPDWLESVLPRIEERARAERARLYFVEDALVGDGAIWMLSAVPARGARRFAVYDPARHGGDDDYPRFLEDFLNRLREGAAGPVYVILEPLPAEDARAVARLAGASGDRLRVFFLPDVLVRLERLAERWREALIIMKDHAAVRDEAARDYRAAKSGEERLRLERDHAIRDCRAAGVPITAVVAHTGLAAKTIYDALGRVEAEADDDGAAPEAVRRDRLARLDAAADRWREAVATMREHARDRERAVAAYRAAKAVEERLRLRRDKAIVAWRTTGIAAGALASRTGLSGGLISQITGKRAPAAGEARHGESGHLLAGLERVGEQWRQALAATEERARVRQEAADACRAGRAVEERLRDQRDQAITACQAAAIPIPDIAMCAGLDVTTVYQMLHANKFAPGDSLNADRVRLMTRLRDVSGRWRQAADAGREYVRVRDEATREWRDGRAAEEEIRQRRDKAITECRAAGVAVTVLASYTRLDISTIYGVCQAPGA